MADSYAYDDGNTDPPEIIGKKMYERGWAIEETERNGTFILIIYFVDDDLKIEPRGQVKCLTKQEKEYWMNLLALPNLDHKEKSP